MLKAAPDLEGVLFDLPEVVALFAAAGLRLERIVPTATPLCIVAGTRA